MYCLLSLLECKHDITCVAKQLAIIFLLLSKTKTKTTKSQGSLKQSKKDVNFSYQILFSSATSYTLVDYD